MLSQRYRKRGRPRTLLSVPVRSSLKNFDFLDSLKERELLTEAEIEIIQKFNSLYHKVMITYGVKVFRSSLPLIGLPTSRGHWELSERDEKKWQKVSRLKNFSPEAWRVLKLLGHESSTRQDVGLISRHLQDCKLLIQALYDIL